jgi:DNA topoisomerase I
MGLFFKSRWADCNAYKRRCCKLQWIRSLALLFAAGMFVAMRNPCEEQSMDMKACDAGTKSTEQVLHARTLRRNGLIYSSDSEPGYRRRRVLDEFVYQTTSGATLRDARVLKRIRQLAIPPAYTDVWICRDARGHLQATGRDARGRKQYRYHAQWRQARDASKYHRMLAFADHLPPLRATVAADMQLAGLPRRKVLAALVRLLETSLIRIGNEEYARGNGSYGLTTLKNGHVRVRGEGMQFRFRGKSGKFHNIHLDDARLARIVRRCQDLPGQALFQFHDGNGAPENIDSDDVNSYIRELTAAEFSAKDFRTWAGTLLTAQELHGAGYADTDAEVKARIASAIREVAQRLGNTPSVCRACYVHPAVLDAYAERKLKLPRGTGKVAQTRLSAQERALQRLLLRHERQRQTTAASAADG